MPPTPLVGSRVVAERLDDRTGGGAVGAADDALLFRLVDNDVSRRLGGDDECEAFSLGVDEIAFGAVAQPAFEEAAGGARLVGGDASQAAAASGPATGLIGGGKHRLQLAAQHQTNVATVVGDTCGNFDLDTPTTERLFESLWPGVSELDDTVAPDSWSEDDFDLLFPDLA
jgi:hypothetical protein